MAGKRGLRGQEFTHTSTRTRTHTDVAAAAVLPTCGTYSNFEVSFHLENLFQVTG